MSGPKLELRLFGNFRASWCGEPLTALQQVRQQALLGWILLHRGPQPREQAATALWPESTGSQARTNLRNLLHRLRRSLPEDKDKLFLQLDSQTLQWLEDAPFQADIDALEEGYEKALGLADDDPEYRKLLEQAVDWYNGPLLPMCYDEWLEPHRKRYAQMVAELLDDLGRHLSKEKDYAAAIRATEALLIHDPILESVHARLIRLHLESGDRAGALRAYHSCVDTLEKELGVPPSPKIQSIYQEMFASEERTEVQLVSRYSPFQGRQSELAQLQGLWRQVEQEGGRVTVISGEPGIGKTRLVEEFLSWVRGLGITTATAHCYQSGGLAWGPALDWLRNESLRCHQGSLSEHDLVALSRILPELRSEAPLPEEVDSFSERLSRVSFFEAMAKAVLSHGHGLVLHLDDVQWCDVDTCSWLHHLYRSATDAPCLILMTSRGEHPLAELQHELSRINRWQELPLEALSKDDTIALGEALSERTLEPHLLEQLYSETEGNPLFIVERMRGDFSKESISRELPKVVQGVIQSRLQQLSPQADSLVTMAAVLGRMFSWDLLLHSSGMVEDDAVDALDELWHKRILLEREGEQYEFSHDKLREVALEQVSQAKRRLLHRKAADALAALHAHNIEEVSLALARHCEHAKRNVDAARHYQRAAIQARKAYANEEAIALLQRSLKLLNPTHNKEHKLLSFETNNTLGEILNIIGRHEEARDVFEAALSQTAGDEALESSHLYRNIGLSWLKQHRYDEAMEASQRAIDVLGKKSSVAHARARLQAQIEQIHVYYWRNEAEKMEQASEAIREDVLQIGSPKQRADYYFGLSSMAMRRDRYNGGEAMLSHTKRFLASSQDPGLPRVYAEAEFMMGFALLGQGEVEAACEHLHTSLLQSRKIGDVWLELRCLTYLTIQTRRAKDLEATRDWAEQSQALAQRLSLAPYVGTARANRAWLALQNDNKEEAMSLANEAISLWDKSPLVYPFTWTAHWPLLALKFKSREPIEECLVHVREILSPTQHRMPSSLESLLQDALESSERETLQSALALAQELGMA